MQENLVIVESPAKAKTIEKFLGKDYMVKSSYGHIRDLVKKGLGVEIDNGFEPVYEIADDKKRLVSELSRLAGSVKNVWLASDEDREGEAIAWHLAQVLNLPVDKTKRIVFHEITRKAILEAIENPRTIDMNLVDAQQARRVLDRLVGFELSPVLWKKVKPSLSAGRVQSVAVRLLVEREREIMEFQPTQYYRITAQFCQTDAPERVLFRAELNRRFSTREEALQVLEQCNGASFSVAGSEDKPSVRYPAAPFTTSTLQQEASRKFGMSVSQTMSVAQRLYEQGRITYMRTDSVNLAAQAIAAAKEQITAIFGEKYSKPRNYKTKTKGAQEAHEAIRPTYLEHRTIEGTNDERRLYELIWNRTVASQMAAAEIDRTVVSIKSDRPGDIVFTATGEVVRFDGFLKLYSESTDDEGGESSQGLLPRMKDGEALTALNVVATQKYTQSPARYNEALLVKRLEELGIGRPSTYAPTITTIINRGYVVKRNKEGEKRGYEQITLEKGRITEKRHTETVGKERGRLAPTDIGMLVNDYLAVQFNRILDYNFTANVEKEFDEIAGGRKSWREMINGFYHDFHATVEEALEAQVERSGQVRVLGNDPRTGEVVSARIGRYGPMVQIGGDDGGKPRYASLKRGQLIASLTLEEALELFALPRTVGEKDGKEVVIGTGRFGPYVRYDGKFTSLPKGDDPYTVTLERALEIVEEKARRDQARKEPVKTFAEEPDMQILNGRYGVYIAYKGKNYRIPKGTDAAALTLEECLKIVEKSKK